MLGFFVEAEVGAPNTCVKDVNGSVVCLLSLKSK